MRHTTQPTLSPPLPRPSRSSPALRRLRRWAAQQAGFEGAEKALLICGALAIILGVGALLQGGSKQAAGDAQHVLVTQNGTAGALGAVVAPLHSTGAIAEAKGQLASPGPAVAGQPAASPGRAAAGQPAAATTPAPAPIAVTSGLGAAVDQIAQYSPTLANNINTLQQSGWTIRYGAAGSGSFTDRTQKTVTIDGNLSGSPLLAVQTLAHESGHARYTPDPYTPPDGLTRDQYINANVWHNLRDEGEATITNLTVRKELNAAGAGDIGVAGAQAARYQQLFDQWDGQNRDAFRTTIGGVYATGEHPSTSPGMTYYDYYAQTFANFYDQNVGR